MATKVENKNTPNMLLSKFFKGSIIVTILFALAALIGYGTRIVFSRNLPLSQYGLFYSVLTFVLSFSIICDYGFGQVIQVVIPKLIKKKRWNDIKAYISAVFIWQVITRILVILSLVLAADYFSVMFFHDPTVKTLIMLLSLSFIFSGFGSFGASIVAFGLFVEVAWLNVIRTASFLGIAILLFMVKKDFIVVAIAYMISMIINDILTLYFFFKKAMPNFFSIKLSISKKIWKNLFKLGIFFTLSSLAVQFLGFVDVYALGYFRTAEELGIYQLVLPTSMFFTFLIAFPIGMMLPTTLARVSRRMQSVYISNIYNVLALLILPVIAFVAVFSGSIMILIFKNYSTLGNLALKLVFINQGVFLLVQLHMAILTGLKKAKELLMVSIIVSIIAVVLTFISTYLFGIIGTILSYLICYIVFFLLTYRIIRKFCSINIKWSYIIKSIIAAIICFVSMYVTNMLISSVLMKIILGGFVGIAVYVSIIFAFKMFDIKALFN